MIVGRRYIPIKTKLAAAICELIQLPHFIAQAMTEEEVLALVEWDHWPARYANGGESKHWNVRPLLVHDHAIKTKADARDAAHERKVIRAVDAHKQAMLLKGTRKKPVKQSRWPKRKLRRK